MAKRPCISDHSPMVSKRAYDRLNIDTLLESLFAVSDSTLIDASFDGLVESRSNDSDQNVFLKRALHVGYVLLEAVKRSVSKRPHIHNAFVWPLSPDITIKVFSMLDTPSVCSAAAACLFFQKCAMDPLCYANIDLATIEHKVNDAVVSTMIQRAGNALQSIKLGVPLPYSTKPSFLTSSCLSYLSASGGALGSVLRRLHLHNIRRMDNIALSASLSVCPSLVDLETVRLNVEVSHTLESMSRHCRLVERFIYESDRGKDDILATSACKEFVLNCPKITTLTLKGCGLYDPDARRLVKRFHELKYVNFSGSTLFTGAFLKNLGTKRRSGNNLEVMILRDCIDLDKVYVELFMEALIEGKFRLLRHLDVSYKYGLAYFDWKWPARRSDLSYVLTEELLEQRPNLCLVDEFPQLELDSPKSESSSPGADVSFSDSSDNSDLE